MTRKIGKEQAESVSDAWAARTAERSGRPPVVPPEIEPKTLSINPADLALLETQEFDAKALATAYGVPSVLLNMALQGGLTYQNPGALGEMWWRFELRNTATRIANALSERLLPRGQFVTIDAADTFAELSDISEENDPTKSADGVDPAPPVRLIGGGTP
jgi:phage portal protein BeeE